jgi:hypothetical protein
MGFNRHLKQRWVDKGYSEHMGSAAVIPPPPDGFRRLYHLTSAEYAISDIVFGRLKVARISSLNDPFELLGRNASNARDRRCLSDRDMFDSENGILCFSEDWTDPVLWTHYGAKQRGICLGFDVKDGFAKKITYQDDRVRDAEIRGKTDKEILDLLLHTKFESWRYEQEWRVLLNLGDSISEGGLHFYRFNEQLKLTEVILGAECSIAHREVQHLVATHHPQANTIKARLAFEKFRIAPDEPTIKHIPE